MGCGLASLVLAIAGKREKEAILDATQAGNFGREWRAAPLGSSWGFSAQLAGVECTPFPRRQPQ